MTLDKLTALRRPRSLTAAARCMIAVAGLATVAACGSAAAPGSGSSGSAPAPKGALNITMQGAPGTPARHWTLHCGPAGGTHPHPAATCAALLADKNPFAKPKRHQMCPMIMAGSKRILISGTWYGQTIHRTVVDGGCDLALFTKLNQVIN